MKIWIERALAALRWGWEKLAALAKVVLAKLQVIFNTVYDPPPKTIRFWFWSWTALVVVVWLAFAFTNSWFYRPAADFLATLGDDGDVFMPDHLEPLPPVATPAVEVPAVEVVCHDMSDTPHCEPVVPAKSESEGRPDTSPGAPAIVENAIQIARSKGDCRECYTHSGREPSLTYQKRKKANRRKREPYQTYWGF